MMLLQRFSLIVLVLASIEVIDTQLIKYADHYYAFLDQQAHASADPIEICLGPDYPFRGFDINTILPAYPLVPNDAAEQTALYTFYQQNSRVDDAFVMLGISPWTDQAVQRCINDTAKPMGIDCHNMTQLQGLDRKYVTYTPWEEHPDNGDTYSDSFFVAWRKQSNAWRKVFEPNDPRVKEVICEYSDPCVTPDIQCLAHGVCLQRTAYSEYACVCDTGYDGTDCEVRAAEPGVSASPAETATESDSSSAVLYAGVAAGCALVLAGGFVAYKLMKRKRNSAPLPTVSYVPSQGSVASATSSVASMTDQ